jgi:hypothetical protein
MKKIFIYSISVLIFVAVFGICESFAQSYPPVVPPSVIAVSDSIATAVNNSVSQLDKDVIMKKVELLETNVNNFVPMLMKNSDNLSKIRDNADSLVADMKKQLQDIKQSMGTYDLKFIEITSRLDNLERGSTGSSSSVGIATNRSTINYVNSPLDDALKNLPSESAVTGSEKKDTDVAVPATDTNKTPVNPSVPAVEANVPNLAVQNQNTIMQNINSNNTESSAAYVDPLSANRIHIPDL